MRLLLLTCLAILPACASNVTPTRAGVASTAHKRPLDDDAALLQKARRAKASYAIARDSATKRQAYFDAVDALPHTPRTRALRFEVAYERFTDSFRHDETAFNETVKSMNGSLITARFEGKPRIGKFSATADHCYLVLTSDFLFRGATATSGQDRGLQPFKTRDTHGFCALANVGVAIGVSLGAKVAIVDFARDTLPALFAYYAEPGTYDVLSQCDDDTFLSFFTQPIPGTVVYDEDGPVLLTQSRRSPRPEGYHLATGALATVKQRNRLPLGETPIPQYVPRAFSCHSISAPTSASTRAIAACTGRVSDAGFAAQERALLSGKSHAYANSARFRAEEAGGGPCSALIERKQQAFLKKFQTLAKTHNAPAMSEQLWSELEAKIDDGVDH